MILQLNHTSGDLKEDEIKLQCVKTVVVFFFYLPPKHSVRNINTAVSPCRQVDSDEARRRAQRETIAKFSKQQSERKPLSPP